MIYQISSGPQPSITWVQTLNNNSERFAEHQVAYVINLSDNSIPNAIIFSFSIQVGFLNRCLTNNDIIVAKCFTYNDSLVA